MNVLSDVQRACRTGQDERTIVVTSARIVLNYLEAPPPTRADIEVLLGVANLVIEQIEDCARPAYSLTEAIEAMAQQSPPFENLRFKGQRVAPPDEESSTAGSSLVAWRAFLRYSAFAFRLLSRDPAQEERLWKKIWQQQSRANSSPVDVGPPGGATWVTIHDRLKDLSPDECYDALGLDWSAHWESVSNSKFESRCVHLASTLAARSKEGLFEPTTIDSLPQVLFCPIKPENPNEPIGRGRTSDPHKDGGLPEAVHPRISLDSGEALVQIAGTVRKPLKSPMEDPSVLISRAKARLATAYGNNP